MRKSCLAKPPLAWSVAICLCVAAPAAALVKHVDDAPIGRPHDAVVGRWRGNASAVAISPTHIVTTRHQGGAVGDSVYFSGVEYLVKSIRAPNQDGLENADLRVVEIQTTTGLPASLPHYISPCEYTGGPPETGQYIVIGGFGKGRGDELKTGGGVTYGYTWAGGNNQTQRWGANIVLGIENNYGAGSYTSDTITLDFDDDGFGGSVDCEAAVAEWDSGCGWFLYDDEAGQWLLAGLTAYAEPGHVDETWFRNNITGDLDPDKNWAIRIHAYVSWILDHAKIGGDANLDRIVNVGDLGVLGNNYGQSSGMTWSDGDFNGDGAVNVGDLGILGYNYGARPDCDGVPPPSGEPGQGGDSRHPDPVPEPAVVFFLAAGIPGLLRRRRSGLDIAGARR